MSWKSEHTAAAALALALALPVGILVAAQRVSRHLQAANYWVLHGGEIEQTLSAFQLDFDELEATARQYTVQGGESVRQRFEQMRTQPGARIAKLRAAKSENAAQSGIVDRLQAAADAQLDLLGRAVELRRAGRGGEAQALLDGRAAYASHAAVQLAAGRAEAEEQTLIAGRRRQLATLSKHWRQVFYGCLLLSLILLLGGFALLVLEVRRRRLAEEALAEERRRLDQSLQRFQRVADNVSAVVWICRQDGSLEYVSERARAALGIEPSRALVGAGRYLEGWIGAEEATKVGDALRRLLAEGGDVGVDARLRSDVGTWQWVHVSARRVRRPDGEIVADGLLVDLTERQRQIEADIAVRAETEANQFRSQFLATVSHELRTPLTAILGFSDLLLSEPAGEMPPDARALAGQIRIAGRNLLALTNDVLDWGKLEAGELRLDAGEMKVEWALAEVADLLAPLFDIREMRLERRLEADAAVWADQGRVRQILTNLLGNAVKFSPPGGVIEVRSQRRGGYLRIEVRDHGMGIPVAEQEGLFERYRQGSGGASVGGTGLGLALVKQLAELHGGEVWVESAPGEGATFGFSLPLMGAAAQAAS